MRSLAVLTLVVFTLAGGSPSLASSGVDHEEGETSGVITRWAKVEAFCDKLGNQAETRRAKVWVRDFVDGQNVTVEITVVSRGGTTMLGPVTLADGEHRDWKFRDDEMRRVVIRVARVVVEETHRHGARRVKARCP